MPFRSAAVASLALLTALASPARGAQTVVSLTFDDGRDTALAAADILERYGMRGTFYLISGNLEKQGYLTWKQAIALQNRGHEIGGHTLEHVALAELDALGQRRQICEDRDALLAYGLDVVSFSYPFTSVNASAKQILAECGYLSARRTSGVGDPKEPDVESIPPADPMEIRTLDGVQVATTIEELQGHVLAAEREGGGSLVLVFHHICEDCEYRMAFTPAALDEFLSWLAARESLGTVVRTIREVVGEPKCLLAPVCSDEGSCTRAVQPDGTACPGGTCHSGYCVALQQNVSPGVPRSPLPTSSGRETSRSRGGCGGGSAASVLPGLWLLTRAARRTRGKTTAS